METTITIPSPSAFLAASPVLQATPLALPTSTTTNDAKPKKKPANAKKTSPKLKLKVHDESGTAPPRKKSRNGCVTCKNKRLKCDERPKACAQCEKRGVTCGGYKKDFKWKPFDANGFANEEKQPKKTKVKQDNQSPPLPEDSGGIVPEYSSDDASPPGYLDTQPLAGPSQPRVISRDDQEEPSCYAANSQPLRPHLSPLQQNDHVQLMQESFSPISPWASQSLDFFPHSLKSISDVPAIWGAKGKSREFGVVATLECSNAQPIADCVTMEISEAESTDPIQRDDEQAAEGQDLLLARTYNHSSNFPLSTIFDRYGSISFRSQPSLGIHSQEYLLLNFNQNTCGILSVRNGGQENPWRSVILPMAHQSPPLANALLCMSAFHATKSQRGESQREMRCRAMELMSQSRMDLSINLANIPADVALATSLTLAFAESWDRHGSTGITYLRGGKALVKQTLEYLVQNPPEQLAEVSRIQFLCRTWLYMDVIARLTRLEEEEEERSEIDRNLWAQIDSIGPTEDVDPLMGCATTLFPIIGKVANLIRQVRLAPTNSLAIVSRANKLKGKLEAWTPPRYLNTPEDPMCHIEHSIQTAEAYRWATLLYLHQAVPEIPSKSSAYLADKVLKLLATVPPESNTIIVQIFPLLAAGSEASEPENRDWVRNRWRKMSSRMQIANIDRCLKLVEGVWELRDSLNAHAASVQVNGLTALTGRPVFPAAASNINESALIDSDYLGFSPPSNFTWGMPQYGGINFAVAAVDTTDNIASSSAQGLVPAFNQSSQLGIKMEPHTAIGSSCRTRRTSSDIVENLPFDLTVRGRLHWIGVMKEWKWEILLG